MNSLLPHFSNIDAVEDLGAPMAASYDLTFVILSVLIASLAAFAGLGGAGRIRAAETTTGKRAWLVTGAVTMGIGVWAMHFVGMLAFKLPTIVGYDVVITLASTIPAILASAVVMYLISRERIGTWRLILGGTLMGAGIGLMHYTGMAAVRAAALMFYDPLIFIVSVLVAVALSILSLYTKFRATSSSQSLTHWTNFLAAGVMGCAISGMHYTGMSAATFYWGDGTNLPDVVLNAAWLGAWVSLATALIIGLAIVVMKYSEHLEKVVAERTKQLASANELVTTLNQQLETENIRMGSELEMTQRLQRMLLPAAQELRDVEGLDIVGFMEAADEIGGDYYDVLQHDGRIKIGIGDVTGHGLESGVVMVMTQAIVRALLASGETDPVRFLSIINRTLCGNVQRMGSDKNLTLCLLDYADGEVKLSGQHEEMIVVRRDGTIEMVDTIDLGFPVGLDHEIDSFINQISIQLQPGDGLVLYTDGITEAENMQDEQYGLQRLCDVVRENWTHSAESIKDAIVSDLKRYIGPQTVYDDITLVVAKQK